jgi:hypothetical protein
MNCYANQASNTSVARSARAGLSEEPSRVIEEIAPRWSFRSGLRPSVRMTDKKIATNRRRPTGLGVGDGRTA